MVTPITAVSALWVRWVLSWVVADRSHAGSLGSVSDHPVRQEEQLLGDHFGAAYREYQTQVSAILPGIW